MSTIKILLRKEDKPLQQLSRRFSEIESVNENFERIRSSELYLDNKHFDDLSLYIKSTILKINTKCCATHYI